MPPGSDQAGGLREVEVLGDDAVQFTGGGVVPQIEHLGKGVGRKPDSPRIGNEIRAGEVGVSLHHAEEKGIDLMDDPVEELRRVVFHYLDDQLIGGEKICFMAVFLQNIADDEGVAADHAEALLGKVLALTSVPKEEIVSAENQ